jgi:hypothetical protein
MSSPKNIFSTEAGKKNGGGNVGIRLGRSSETTGIPGGKYMLHKINVIGFKQTAVVCS